MDIKPQQFNRKPSSVEAVQVSKPNIRQAAEWCGGRVLYREDNGNPYVKLDPETVNQGTPERYAQAYVGDWILRQGRSYKVYTDRAFRKNYNDGTLDVATPVDVLDEMLGTPIYDQIYLEIHSAITTCTGDDSMDEETARRVTDRVVVLARGDGKTELIPVPDTSVFFTPGEEFTTPADRAAFKAALTGSDTTHQSEEEGLPIEGPY